MTEPEAASGPERLVVGLVRGVHGLRGVVRVEVLSDDEGRFAPGRTLFPEGSTRILTITWRQRDEPGLLVSFAEVGSREEAEPLRGVYLEADAPASALPEGVYYWHELLGAEVRSTEGAVLGAVEDVFRAGEAEVFVVSGGSRGELLIPAVGAFVREFAPREGRVVVDAEALGLEDEAPPRPRGRRSSRA